MRTQLADAHLVYRGVPAVHRTRCNVYRRDNDVQLGWVEKTDRGWRGWDFGSQTEKVGRTRWEVATALWGTA